MSVALDYLFKWVDTGTVPPRAQRILLDRDQSNDGSMMALDEHGNPKGGIRTRYVDVPTAKYAIRPAALNPVVPNAAPYIATGGQNAANLMCGLSTAQIALAPAKLKELYKNKQGQREGRRDAAHRAREGGLVAPALSRDDPRRCGKGGSD